MRDYLLNFWVWWYMVKVVGWGKVTISRIVFMLEYTNTLSMARNFNQPLFQDSSGFGKIFAVLLRSIWIWVGGMFTIILATPLVLIWLISILIPALSIAMLILAVSLSLS